MVPVPPHNERLSDEPALLGAKGQYLCDLVLLELFFRLTAFRPAYDARITAHNAPCQAKKYSPIILRVFQSFEYTNTIHQSVICMSKARAIQLSKDLLHKRAAARTRLGGELPNPPLFDCKIEKRQVWRSPSSGVERSNSGSANKKRWPCREALLRGH